MCFSLLLCVIGNLYNKRDSSDKGRRVKEKEIQKERKEREEGREERKKKEGNEGRNKIKKEGREGGRKEGQSVFLSMKKKGWCRQFLELLVGAGCLLHERDQYCQMRSSRKTRSLTHDLFPFCCLCPIFAFIIWTGSLPSFVFLNCVSHCRSPAG